jgi:hypothetical protein
VDDAGGADLAAFGDVPAELVGHRAVALVDVAVHEARRNVHLEHHVFSPLSVGRLLDRPPRGRPRSGTHC